MEMDKSKSIDLIKAHVIGCLEDEDIATLNSSMENDDDFPWQELGKYQNLVSIIPSSLQLELPNQELKDKVARKLYSIRDEIIASKQKELITEEEPDTIEEEIDMEEISDVKEEGIEIKEPVLPHPHALPGEDVEAIVESRSAEVETKFKESLSEEKIEKKIKEYITTYYESKLDDLRKTNKKFFIINLVLTVLALAAIAYLFLNN
jgi:flagellar basal body-associated protein FliL